MEQITKRCTGIVHQPQFSNESRPAQYRDRRRYAAMRINILNITSLAVVVLGGCNTSLPGNEHPSAGGASQSGQSPETQSLDGDWYDAHGDHALRIHTTSAGTKLSDAAGSRWASEFTEIAFHDGVLSFTQTSSLKTGEYHPVNDVRYPSELQIDTSHHNIATLTYCPPGTEPQVVKLKKAAD